MKCFYILPAFVLLTSCSRSTRETVPMDAARFHRDATALLDKRIYFAHQSVGRNVLDGMRSVLSANGLQFHFRSLEDPAPGEGPFFADSSAGSNADPRAKCDAFRRAVESVYGGDLDIALMKFCYIDFDRSTDPESLLQSYAQTVDEIRKKYPRLTIVHVTVPLTAPLQPWRRAANILRMREDAGALANHNRNAFNSLLLARYRDEPVFDLAAVESTNLDGSRATFRYAGRTGYCLSRDFTPDGGHLNALGAQRAAEALVHTLAEASRSRSL